MIRFVLKSAFWLTLAFVLMPKMFPSTADNGLKPGDLQQVTPTVLSGDDKSSAASALGSSVATITQMARFCMDHAALCEGGKNAVLAAGTEAVRRSLGANDNGNQPVTAQPTVIRPGDSRAGSGAPNDLSKIPVPQPRDQALRRIPGSSADHRP